MLKKLNIDVCLYFFLICEQRSGERRRPAERDDFKRVAYKPGIPSHVTYLERREIFLENPVVLPSCIQVKTNRCLIDFCTLIEFEKMKY